MKYVYCVTILNLYIALRGVTLVVAPLFNTNMNYKQE